MSTDLARALSVEFVDYELVVPSNTSLLHAMASYRYLNWYLKPQTADIIRRSRGSFKRLSTMITCSILALAGVHTFYIVRITVTYGAGPGTRSLARCCPLPRAPTGSVPPHRPRLVRRLVRRLVGHARLVSY